MSSMLTLAGNAAPTGFYDFPIEQSLRFNDDDNAYLSRTPASAGNRKTWTFSCWVKRGKVSGTDAQILTAYTSASDTTNIIFQSGGAIQWYDYISSYRVHLVTNALFRDVGSWYHLLFQLDTSNAISGDRAKIYVNGERVTSFNTEVYPSLNADLKMNTAIEHRIGDTAQFAREFDGYMADVNFIDGQALDPTSFGELKSGIWIPKDTADLTFGTNGFRLQFGDTTEASGFNALAYTGNQSNLSVNGCGFSPDLVWIKSRTNAYNHELYDTVRGVQKALQSSTTNLETTETQGLSSFDSDGFSLGSRININEANDNHVAWAWDAGSGSAASNTDGSITSTVKANTDYGFSIVSYTGTGSATSWGHGLGVQPDMVIVKNRSGTNNWAVYHSEVPATQALLLSATNAAFTTGYWNNTAPTSSIVNISGDGIVNTSGNNYIAYCFAEKTGYSKFGSYTGTGAAGNSITGLGFKPAFVMTKKTSGASNWNIIDNTRNTSNPVDNFLIANGSNTEFSGYDVDFTSTGFTLNNSEGGFNGSGETYIYMAFADTRDAAFWRDTSGEGNDWQPNNLVFSDVVPDSTTNNFAVLNRTLPDSHFNTDQLSEGNLFYNEGQGNNGNGRPTATIGVTSGKWYWEVQVPSQQNSRAIGFTRTDNIGKGNVTLHGSGFTSANSVVGIDLTDDTIDQVDKSGTHTQHASGLTGMSNNDIFGISVDLDGGTFQMYRNGSTYGSSYSLDDLSDWQTHGMTPTASGDTYQAYRFNFGQDSTFAGATAAGGYADENGYGDFQYAVPSGFLSLNSANLPTGAIDTLADETPEDYFNTVLYSATAGVAGSVTGYGFAPDWLWTKARNTTQSHQLFDNVRGDGVRLITNSTGAESALGASYVSLEDDGFDYGSSTFTSNNFVGWGWKANGAGVSNTDGSITSTVSVGATSQQNWFSVVSYTGDTTQPKTVGHGLGVTPDLILLKNRDTTDNWSVYHSSVMTGGDGKFMRLNTTDALLTDGSDNVFDTGFSSTTFGVGRSSASGGASDYIAYCFANAEGLCKVGSYVGNGSSTDGTFVYTGFRPSFLLVKNTSISNQIWLLLDAKRGSENVISETLEANNSNAESNNDRVDFVSNGFKWRNNYQNQNNSGNTYIYLAIAEQPFAFANAR